MKPPGEGKGVSSAESGSDGSLCGTNSSRGPRLRPHNMRQGRGQRVMQGVWKIRGGRDNMYLKLEKASKQSGLCEAGWNSDRYRWGAKVLNGWRNNMRKSKNNSKKERTQNFSTLNF